MDEQQPPQGPNSSPPVIPPAPPPLPPRRREPASPWKILVWVFLAVIGLGFIFLLAGVVRGVLSPAGPSRTRERPLQELIIADHRSPNKIVVLDVQGMITSFERGGLTMAELVQRQLRRAKRDGHVRAVVVRINSPGGEVLASDEIHNALVEFQQETDKPVVASMGALAASGGYYVAAPCQWIVANELTITGSIGVILQGFNYRSLMDKIGVQPEVYKSGEHKNMLSGGRWPEEIPDEERLMVNELVMQTFSRFTNVVAQGRDLAHQRNSRSGRTLSPEWTNYVDGRVFSGAQAYELGFVDELGTLKDAVERAQRLAGIPDANLIQYQQPLHLGDLFRLFGQSRPTSFKIDLGVDIPRLQPGYLYFVTPIILP